MGTLKAFMLTSLKNITKICLNHIEILENMYRIFKNPMYKDHIQIYDELQKYRRNIIKSHIYWKTCIGIYTNPKGIYEDHIAIFEELHKDF